MTVEERFIVDLSELVALRLACNLCGAAVVVNPLEWREAPGKCPSCNGWWSAPEVTAHGFTPMQHFAIGLRQLREQVSAAKKTDKTLPYRVLLEMNDPSAAKYR